MDEINTYLQDHWKRALDSRSQQVDDLYSRWDKNYHGVPAEKVRTVPFYKSSNLVVKVARMFVDTFVARTLNIIFATRPLYTVDGFPREVKEGLELYLNRKALYSWKHYKLAREILHRGAKNGTAVTKVVWDERATWKMSLEGNIPLEERILEWEGPLARIIPFEDFAVYPITANYMCDVIIAFHRVRYPEERARYLQSTEEWDLTAEELEQALEAPTDLKKSDTALESGVEDTRYRELQVVECHLDYAIGSDPAKLYSIVALLSPKANKLIDLYFNPNPRNQGHFYDYRPLPKEDFFYGESMCELLESLQEEISQIHNDRRNNAMIANAPVFKRRNGANIPNPSTNWYPGKVFDLDSMDDLDLVMIGRNFDPMIDQESFDMQLVERLSGIGAVMQGYAAGMMGKRGIYNASGTIALMQESNQRQDTNIRDVREVISGIARASYALQVEFGQEDPTIAYFSPEVQEQIKEAFRVAAGAMHQCHFEVKTSTAGVNAEVEKTNLMQMAQILERYGATAQQLTMQLVNPKLNPALRAIMNDTLQMQRWMAQRLLRAFNELDAEGVIPDVRTALEQHVGRGAGAGTKDLQGAAERGMEPGAPEPAGPPLSREQLGAFSQMAVPTV